MSKATITVWEPGTEIQLPENLVGQIVSVQLQSDGSILYEIAWWKEYIRYTGWLSKEEFTVGSSDPVIQIGFK